MKRNLSFKIYILFCLSIMPLLLYGEVVHCVHNATELQNALTAAQSNGDHDLIKVVQGIYIGNFVFDSSEGYDITLLGGYTSECAYRVVDPSNTILDGGGSGRVLSLQDTYGGNIHVEGFTIQNGYEINLSGGGIYAYSYGYSVKSGSITLKNNIIKNNTAKNGGGGYVHSYAYWMVDSGDITFINNSVTGNNCSTSGGGIYIYTQSKYEDTGNVTLTNNTITENSSGENGGGIYLAMSKTIKLYNNIIWGNTALSGKDIYLFAYEGTSSAYNNDYSYIYGSWTFSANNINADPHFIGGGDYHLHSNSPCVDTGTNTASYLLSTDFEGDPRSIDGNSDGVSTADIGADEYIPTQLPVFDGNDFNNNGSSDISVWRPSVGIWHIKDVTSQQWGIEGDIPVNGYYNADSVADLAIWRPSDGNWYIKGIAVHKWGSPKDIPVPADYNGDGLTDIAVWRTIDGRWHIKDIAVYQWGTAADILVPRDYNGDGIADIAVWRRSNGIWYIKGISFHQWGIAGDIPVPGDYDGDGVTDIAVWRPTNGIWYIKDVGDYHWGIQGDIPVPGDYDGDGVTDIAVWRPTNGIWYIRGVGNYQWGIAGDIPLVR